METQKNAYWGPIKKNIKKKKEWGMEFSPLSELQRRGSCTHPHGACWPAELGLGWQIVAGRFCALLFGSHSEYSSLMHVFRPNNKFKHLISCFENVQKPLCFFSLVLPDNDADGHIHLWSLYDPLCPAQSIQQETAV